MFNRYTAIALTAISVLWCAPAHAYNWPESNSWDAWDNRVKITTSSANLQGTTHTDFPLSIDLGDTMPVEFWQNVDTTCDPTCADADIIVVSSDHATKYDREIGYITVTDPVVGTGEGSLYFKDPSLSATANEDYWIYFNNTASAEANATTTWVNYAMVAHFDEDAILANPTTWCNAGQTGVFKDSTGNNNECIYKVGAPLAAQTGIMGRSVWLDGIDDRFYIFDPGTSAMSVTGAGAIQALVYMQTGTDAAAPVLHKHRNNTSSIGAAGNMEYFLAESGGKWRAGVSSNISPTSTFSILYNGWQSASYRWGASPGRSFVVGGSNELIDSYTGVPSLTNWHAHIGYRTVNGGGARLVQGYYDEIRLSKTNRTVEWIRSDTYILENNAAFWGVGTVEPAASNPPIFQNGGTSGIGATASTSRRVDLTWNEATDAINPPVTYDLYWGPTDPVGGGYSGWGSWPNTQAVTPSCTGAAAYTCTLTGFYPVDAGLTYFAVKATNNAAVATAFSASDSTSVTVVDDTSPPVWQDGSGKSALTTPLNTATKQWDVSWVEADDAIASDQYVFWYVPDDLYNLDFSTVSEAIRIPATGHLLEGAPANTSVYDWDGCTGGAPQTCLLTIHDTDPGRTYHASVQACDTDTDPGINCTTIDWTDTASNTAPAAISQPDLHLTAVAATSITLDWAEVGGPDHYELYRCDSATTCDYKTGTLENPHPTPPKQFTGLTTGQWYSFALYSCNDVACLQRSDVSMVPVKSQDVTGRQNITNTLQSVLLMDGFHPHQGNVVMQDGFIDTGNTVSTGTGYQNTEKIFGDEVWIHHAFDAYGVLGWETVTGYGPTDIYFGVQEAIGEVVKNAFRLNLVSTTYTLTKIVAGVEGGALTTFSAGTSAANQFRKIAFGPTGVWYSANNADAWTKYASSLTDTGGFVVLNGGHVNEFRSTSSPTTNDLTIVGTTAGGTCQVLKGGVSAGSAPCAAGSTLIELTGDVVAGATTTPTGPITFDINGTVLGKAISAMPGDEWAVTSESITSGPRQQHISATTARVSARFNVEGSMAIGTRPSADAAPGTPCTGVETCSGASPALASNDNVAVLEVGGLAPATGYAYRVIFDGVVQTPASAGVEPVLTTRPLVESGAAKIMIGSCMAETGRPFTTLETILPLGIDVALHEGDIVYGSTGGVTASAPWQGLNNPMTIGDFQLMYGSTFMDLSFAKFMTQVPMMFQADNHDYGSATHVNGFSGDTSAINGEAAFIDWVERGNPDEPALTRNGHYFEFNVGGVHVAGADMSSYRTFDINVYADTADYRTDQSATDWVVGTDKRSISCPSNDCATIVDASIVRLGTFGAGSRWYEVVGDGVAGSFSLRQAYQGTTGVAVPSYAITDMKSALGAFKDDDAGNWTDTYNNGYYKTGGTADTSQLVWLMNTLADSTSPVKLISTSKVLVNGVNAQGWDGGEGGYQGYLLEIQTVLAHIRAEEATPSTLIVSGGDVHHGDITLWNPTFDGEALNVYSFGVSGYGSPGFPPDNTATPEGIPLARLSGAHQVGVVDFDGADVLFRIIDGDTLDVTEFATSTRKVAPVSYASSSIKSQVTPHIAQDRATGYHAVQFNTGGNSQRFTHENAGGFVSSDAYPATLGCPGDPSSWKCSYEVGGVYPDPNGTDLVVLESSYQNLAGSVVRRWDASLEAFGTAYGTWPNQTRHIYSPMVFPSGPSGLCYSYFINEPNTLGEYGLHSNPPNTSCATTIASTSGTNDVNPDGNGIAAYRRLTGFDTGQKVVLIWTAAGSNEIYLSSEQTTISGNASNLTAPVGMTGATVNYATPINITADNEVVASFGCDTDRAGKILCAWEDKTTFEVKAVLWNDGVLGTPFTITTNRGHTPNVVYKDGKWFVVYLHYDRVQVPIYKSAVAAPSQTSDFAVHPVLISDPWTKRWLQVVKNNGSAVGTQRAIGLYYQRRSSKNYSKANGRIVHASVSTFKAGNVSVIYMMVN